MSEIKFPGSRRIEGFRVCDYSLHFAIFGPERARLQEMAQWLTQQLSQDRHFTDAWAEPRPVDGLQWIDVDREKAAALGLALKDISANLEIVLGSAAMVSSKTFSNTLQVRVKAEGGDQPDLESVTRLQVRNDKGRMIPLGAVATIRRSSELEPHERLDLFPAVSITANLTAGTSPSDARSICERLAATEFRKKHSAENRLVWLQDVSSKRAPEQAEPTAPGADDRPQAQRSARTFEGAKAGDTRSDNSLNMKLTWCPPGRFTMGSPKDDKERSSTEDQVQVTLTTGFWLGQYEVTQAEWRRIMQTAPWSGQDSVKEGDEYSASYISWGGATIFCEKLTKQERAAGRLPAEWEYTLPTEAQWEYACRAGTTFRFSFGDDASNLGDYAWFEKNAWDVRERYPHQAGKKKANPWGLFDMHGNVFEWCRDWHDDKRSGGTDPQGPSPTGVHVVHGGSWRSSPGGCRSAFRSSVSESNHETGFRVAAVPSGK